MKTNIFSRTVAVMAALSCLFGCTNPEVEIHKGVSIRISPSTILSGFTALKSGDFDMFSDSHLRITCLIYDKDEKLAYKEQSLLDNFNQDITVYTTLDEGEYTLIALATCIQGELSSPSIEAYSISGIESLDQLQVKQERPLSYYSTWSMMGYASQVISPGNSPVSVDLKPATSLVYLRWQDIHAHDNDGFATGIYGEYSAKASDFWGKNEYSWKITVEKDGNSNTDVIIKNFSPGLYTNGFTSEKGYNTYKGKINGNTLTISMGQATGYTDGEGSVLLYGGEANGTMITFKDIVLRISAGKLTTANMFGTCVPGGSGWYELFNSGVEFTKRTSSAIDEYYIIYHPNDVLQFTHDGTPRYSSSLSVSENRGEAISPAKNTSATNIYSMHNLFPGTSINLFARTFSGNTATDYSRQTFTLASGHQYVFNLDCDSFKLTPYEGVIGSRASGDGFEPIEGNGLPSIKHVDFSQKQFN